MSTKLVAFVGLLAIFASACDASIGGGPPCQGASCGDDDGDDVGDDDDGGGGEDCSVDDDCAADERCDGGGCVAMTVEYIKLEDWSMSPFFSSSIAGLQAAGQVLDAGGIYVLDIVNLEDTTTYDFDLAFVSYPQGTAPAAMGEPFDDAQGSAHGGAFASPRTRIYDLNMVPAAATCVEDAMCVVDAALLGEKPAGGNWIHSVTGMSPTDKGVRVMFDWQSPPPPSRDVYIVTR